MQVYGLLEVGTRAGRKIAPLPSLAQWTGHFAHRRKAYSHHSLRHARSRTNERAGLATWPAS
jgi:hypothetical protein